MTYFDDPHAARRNNSKRVGQGRITVTCHHCGEISPDYTDSDLGRQMVNLWHHNHECPATGKSAWRAA